MFVVIVTQLVTQSIYARLKLASVGGLVHVMIAGGFPVCQCECIEQ